MANETVTTHGTRHATSTEVYSRIASQQTITDECAAALASWYQSPRGHGLTFAQLAQGSHVLVTDLQDAIAAESALPGTYGPDLDALSDWLNSTAHHPSDEDLRAALTPSPRQAKAAARLAKGRTGV